MKIAKTRRDKLFRYSKPTFRPAVYDDIRWFWASARRQGYEGTPEEFSRQAEESLAGADRIVVAEDTNGNYEKGAGPVGVFLSNYDGWTLAPHVEWFPWATPRNKLRCTVGFLQSMRYARDIGSIKIFAEARYAGWFKRLKKYVPVSLVGKITGGRETGDEYIFHLRGRGRNEQHIRREDTAGPDRRAVGHTETAGGIA